MHLICIDVHSLLRRMAFGGSLIRPEATGYGLVFFVENMLAAKGETLKVRRIKGGGFPCVDALP